MITENEVTELTEIKNQIGSEKYYWMMDIMSTCDYNQLLGLLKLLDWEWRNRRKVLPEYFRQEKMDIRP